MLDTSQLLQDLANVRRNNEETIPEYGARINQILNMLVTQTLENTPTGNAEGICEAYRITTIGNFLRGLDKNIHLQIKDKEINTLENAISLANQADIQWKGRNRVHKLEITGNLQINDRKLTLRKQIAHIRTSNDGAKSREQIQCFQCKEFGHIRRFCPENNVRGEENNKGYNYCYLSNHLTKDCKVKSRHEGERQTLKRKRTDHLNGEQGRRNGGSATLIMKAGQTELSSISNPRKT